MGEREHFVSEPYYCWGRRTTKTQGATGKKNLLGSRGLARGEGNEEDFVEKQDRQQKAGGGREGSNLPILYLRPGGNGEGKRTILNERMRVQEFKKSGLPREKNLNGERRKDKKEKKL